MQLEAVPSKLALLLAIERQLAAVWEATGSEGARRNLSVVRKLLLTEKVRQWADHHRVKIAAALRIVLKDTRGWIDGLLEGAEDLLSAEATLRPALRTRGAVRTRGTGRTKPAAVNVTIRQHPEIEATVCIKAGKVEIGLQGGGRPLPGVAVWMVSEKAQTVGKSVTDSSGKACFLKPPSGSAVLLIEESQS